MCCSSADEEDEKLADTTSGTPLGEVGRIKKEALQE